MSVWVESPTEATFIHLEKTGGTSVELWLNDNTTSHRVGKHSSYDKMSKWCRNNNKSMGLVFSIIRNPFERELSWYMYFLQKTKFRLDWAKKGLPDSFLENKIQKKYNIEKNQEILKEFNSNAGFKKMITESSSISPQYHAVKQCNLILRLENINQDFKQISTFFKSKNNLPHMNKSKHDHYTTYFDDELKELVYEKHKIDFDQFGYKF